MTKRPRDPVKVDTAQFETIEEAIERASVDRPFEDLARQILRAYSARGGDASLLLTFFGSAVSRARALHEAIIREIQATNPPATMSLLRQLAETVAVTFYVADHPKYVNSIARRPDDRLPNTPKRLSIQKLISYMDRNYSHQFKAVYDDLCEMTHFGSTALWSSHRIAEAEDGRFSMSWSSEPRWKVQEDALTCCAHLLELSDGMNHGLLKVGEALVKPLT